MFLSLVYKYTDQTHQISLNFSQSFKLKVFSSTRFENSEKPKHINFSFFGRLFNTTQNAFWINEK